MAASYSITGYTSNSVTIKITTDSNYDYYRVFIRYTSDSSSEVYDKVYNITASSKTITISGLSASTNYTMNVGYNNDGTEGVTWIGGKTFTTSAAETTYSVTLKFNANGGSAVPSQRTFTDTDSSVSCTIPSTKPTRSGYTFLGWSTSSTATSASYQPSTTYNFTGSTAGKTYTLYAVWKQNTYYAKLVYNANGGSGAPSAQSKNSSTSQTISFTIPSTKPTRSGYTFLGWSTSSTATSATYDPGDTYSIRSTSTSSSSPTTKTLYAVWVKYYYAKVVYNANGGSGAPSSQTFSGTSTSVSVTLSETEPTKSGATFMGWSTSPSPAWDEADYFPGDTITLTGSTSTTTHTLYACWYQESYTVRITYVPIDESGETGDQFYYDTDSQVPVKMPTLSMSGEVFLGWSTNISATSAEYLPGSTYNFTGSADVAEHYVLYAIFQPKYYVQINFNANGGDGAPDSRTYSDADSNVSCAFPSDIPTRDGYTFLGWAYSSSATSPSYNAGGTYNLEGSIGTTTYTFYAVWHKNKLGGVVKIGNNYYNPYICHGGTFELFKSYVCEGAWKATTEGD